MLAQPYKYYIAFYKTKETILCKGQNTECLYCGKERLHFGENLPRALIESCSEIFILANSRYLRWAKESGAILLFHNEALLEMYPNEFSLRTFLHLEWPLSPAATLVSAAEQ